MYTQIQILHALFSFAFASLGARIESLCSSIGDYTQTVKQKQKRTWKPKHTDYYSI